jgi:hypothetical protein
MKLRISLTCMVGLVAVIAVAGAAQRSSSDAPQFTPDGQLRFPQGYREWIFLSSGLGMTYGPLGAQARKENPRFDNVFVDPSSYASFRATGRWPDKTVLILEVRASQSNGSINRGGHFQTEPVGIEAHVKDESRFPDKWAFFGFRNGSDTAREIPKSESCYSCHTEHGAVDSTFVQFYPTLIEAAKKNGTWKLAEPLVK